MKTISFILALGLAGSAWAKLPPPSEEAKAKAAQAGKVDAYKLCKSYDKVASHVQKTNKAKMGKPVDTPACVDPGPYVPKT
jgi:hypothetical protein